MKRNGKNLSRKHFRNFDENTIEIFDFWNFVQFKNSHNFFLKIIQQILGPKYFCQKLLSFDILSNQ